MATKKIAPKPAAKAAPLRKAAHVAAVAAPKKRPYVRKNLPKDSFDNLVKALPAGAADEIATRVVSGVKTAVKKRTLRDALVKVEATQGTSDSMLDGATRVDAPLLNAGYLTAADLKPYTATREELPQGGMKPTNPKDAIAANKLPLHLWPATATAMGCIGMLEGREKYGRSNFRSLGALASVYVDALKRHMDAWMEGEDVAPDSGVPHLANALSCLAIIVDTQAAGVLTDDRNVEGGYRKLVESLTPHVARIVEMHADKQPKHYTIQDSTK